MPNLVNYYNLESPNALGEEHLFRKFVIRTNLSLRYVKVIHITL